MPQLGNLVPCPLGARCHKGQKHYENSKVYREHLREAQASGLKSAGDKQANDIKFGDGTSAMFSKSPDGKSSKIDVPGSGSVRVGERMTKKFSDYDGSNGYPPHLLTSWRINDEIEKELTNEGFSSVVTTAAVVAANLKGVEKSLDDLLGNDTDAMKVIGDAYYIDGPVEYEYHHAYAKLAAKKAWDEFEMRPERVDVYETDHGTIEGLVTVSANVNGQRHTSVLDYSSRQHIGDGPDASDKDIARSALYQAVENHFTLEETGGVEGYVLEDWYGEYGAIGREIRLQEESGADVSMWRSAKQEDIRKMFKDEWESATERMTEEYSKFREDQEKVLRISR
jgi:hypothetical protein